MQRGFRLLVPFVTTAVLVAGCGSSPHTAASHPAKNHKAHHANGKTSKGQDTTGSSGSQSQGSSSSASTTGASSSSTANGPSLTYTMMPAGAAQGAAASLGISHLPQGWRLVSMSLVGPGSLQVTTTFQAATTGVFSPAQGGFSVGAGAQIITFFFPYPAGNWAGQTVHFSFSFATSSAAPQSVNSQSFTFPSE